MLKKWLKIVEKCFFLLLIFPSELTNVDPDFVSSKLRKFSNWPQIDSWWTAIFCSPDIIPDQIPVGKSTEIIVNFLFFWSILILLSDFVNITCILGVKPMKTHFCYGSSKCVCNLLTWFRILYINFDCIKKITIFREISLYCK